MSNNEIITHIYHTIDITGFTQRVVLDSTQESREDLCQYIYLYLLEYNNEKLNMLYNKKLLPQFIMKIILNQRNYYRSYYNLSCRTNVNELPDTPYEDDSLEVREKNSKLDFIDEEFNNEELDIKIKVRYELYKVYLTKKYTLMEISEKYSIPYNTLHRLIKETKKIIRLRYDNTSFFKYNE
jgi:hypothetical protein